MINNKTITFGRPYQAPASELLETLPEAVLCVSGDGEIPGVGEEEWGTF